MFDFFGDATDAMGRATGTSSAAPGKRTLTQSLPASNAASPAPPAAPAAPAAAAAPVVADDPFGLHLTKQAVRPALENITRHGKAALKHLENDVEPDVVITGIAPRIATELAEVRGLVANQRVSEPPDVLQALLEAATRPLLEVRLWLDSRQGTGPQIALFQTLVISHLDALRALTGMAATGSIRDTPPLSPQELREARDEERKMDALRSRLHSVLIERLEAIEIGVEDFEKLAALKRPPPRSSAWASVARATFTSVLTNVVGHISKFVGGEWLGPLVEGALGGEIERVVNGAVSTVADDNQQIRDRRLFAVGLRRMKGQMVHGIWRDTDARIERRLLTPAALERTIEDLTASSPKQLSDDVYREAARGFALLTARLGLKTEADPTHGERSDMSDYEGRDEEIDVVMGKPMRIRVGDKRQTAGVGTIQASIENGAVKVEQFRIRGMNDDMAIAVLTRAGRRLANIGIPIEIHVDSPITSLLGSTVLVDEHGTVQGALDWQHMGKPPSNDSVYASPRQLWDALKNVQLGAHVARISEGG